MDLSAHHKRRHTITAFAFLLVLAQSVLAEPIAGTRLDVDWQRLVSAQDITITSPPKDSYQGLLLGNGDIAVSVFGPSELLTLQVGKNDLWDYRDPMDDERPVKHADFLAKYADVTKPAVTNYLFDPAVDAHNVRIRRTYELPSPTSKPAGQLRFRTKPRPGGSYQARLHLWNAEADVSTGAGRPSLRTFVSHPQNLIAAVFKPGDTCEVDIELARHTDCTKTIPTRPEVGTDGRRMWVRYKFPADPSTYPNGFEYAMVARVLGGEARMEAVADFAKISQFTWRTETASDQVVETIESACVAHVKSADPVTVLVAICTTRDDPHPFERAKQVADKAAATGLAALEHDHRQWWHNFWQRSFVDVVGRPFLNQQWYFGQYLLACSQRPGCVAPGLFGSWAWEDFPAFGNDYHWDYNMQQAIWGAFSSNHLDETVPYEDAVIALLPAAVTDARETYGLDGAKFFLTSYPHTYKHNPFPLLHYDKMMSLNGWVAHPLWWKYLYGQDREYLRSRAYPVMWACAQFYKGYLSKAADGRYEIWPTAAWDVDFTPHLKFNRNFPMDLSFVKYLLRATAEASEILDVDEDLRPNWLHIADNLHPYPTADTPTGKVFSAYEGSTSNYHFPLAAMMIFPGDDIGLHSPPADQETARRTLAPMTYSGDEQLLKAMMHARMGIDDQDAFEQQLRATTRPNGTRAYGGQTFFWLHGAGDTIWTNERLLQSYTGVLRLLPVPQRSAVRFGRLRAVGGFLVSGEVRTNGELAYAAIESEAGKVCKLILPWTEPARIRELSSMKQVPVEHTGDTISFPTTRGATYVIDRATTPWDDMPTTTVRPD